MRSWIIWITLAAVVFVPMQIWRESLEDEVASYNQRVEAHNAEYQAVVDTSLPEEAEMTKINETYERVIVAKGLDAVISAAAAHAQISGLVASKLAMLTPVPVARRFHEKTVTCLRLRERQARRIQSMGERAKAGTLTRSEYRRLEATLKEEDQLIDDCRKSLEALGREVDSEFETRAKQLDSEREALEAKIRRYRFVAWGLRLGSAAVGLVGSRRK